MSTADFDRLDALRHDLHDLLVSRFGSFTSALEDGGDARGEATSLLGAVKAAQELTHGIVSTELELRRLSRVRPQDTTGRAAAQLARLTERRGNLVEGLSSLVHQLRNG